MHVRWLTAFVDLPSDRFEAGVDFWLRVTASELSPPRGDDGEFATLLPSDGDPYVRVQRTSDGPRIHLDLHVDDIDDARRMAEELGATVAIDLGHVVMTSPAGLTFCFVSHHGESTRPSAGIAEGGRLDQVCIDIPPAIFEAETAFWSALTGWDLQHSSLDEFAVLVQPPTSPLRILFQRLGSDDGATSARAHLDLACGDRTKSAQAEHEALGATFVHEGVVWITMRDPAGLLYCLTRRDPVSGLLLEQPGERTTT